jgi:fatty acid omega-hydroxylase
MHDILGNGIFNADGDLWKIQRKTALNIFSVKNYKEFVGKVFLTEMNLLGIQLARVADESSEIDLQELFFKFTLDSFCKIGFNVCVYID